MLNAIQPTFLLRFSDTQTGAVSIGFVCEEDGMKGNSNERHSIVTICFSSIPFGSIYNQRFGSTILGSANCIMSTIKGY